MLMRKALILPRSVALPEDIQIKYSRLFSDCRVQRCRQENGLLAGGFHFVAKAQNSAWLLKSLVPSKWQCRTERPGR
jgi:hypothetical protein